MTNLSRMAALGAALASMAFVAAPASAAPVGVTGVKPEAKARIIKPLTLKSVRGLDFGTIVMGAVAAGGETVSLSAAGVRSCGAGGLTCDPSTPGATARFNVTGTQGQVIKVSSPTPTVKLTGSNGGELTFTYAFPPNFTMSNSGTIGDNFDVGGSITIVPATVDGVYAGEIDVQVDYL